MGRKLAVVKDDEPRPSAAPKNLKAAAEHSERALLEMLRDKVTSEIEKGVPPHALAPLIRQVRDLDKEIRALDARESEDDIGTAAATPDEEWAAR